MVSMNNVCVDQRYGSQYKQEQPIKHRNTHKNKLTEASFKCNKVLQETIYIQQTKGCKF